MIFQNRSHQARDDLVSFAKILQKSHKTQKQIAFLMEARDFRGRVLNCTKFEQQLGRRVLEIIAQNEFYELLENDDVGIIVEQMWNGPHFLSIVYLFV